MLFVYIPEVIFSVKGIQGIRGLQVWRLVTSFLLTGPGLVRIIAQQCGKE